MLDCRRKALYRYKTHDRLKQARGHMANLAGIRVVFILEKASLSAP